MGSVWQVGLSFVVGGIWVAAATTIAERRGTRLGGFIGGLPSTLAVALLFMAITAGRETASAAGLVGPLAFGVNSLYVLIFAVSARWGFYPAMGISMVAWAGLQFSIVWLEVRSLPVVLLLWAVCFGVCYWGVEKVLRIRSMPAVARKVGAGTLVLRAVGSGLLVALAVVASQVWGAVAGGVLASIPVVFISSLFITYHTVGIGFTLSLARSIVFSSVITCSSFALAFHFAVLAMPVFPAFVLSYAVMLAIAVPVYRLRLG